MRYAVRALAGERLDPASIVTRFDALYRGASLAPEAFVSLFVGIHDAWDNATYLVFYKRGQIKPTPQ